MKKENKKTIEIPFGAKDSELMKAEYTIPEGMEAIIDGNKVIIRKKESEDERIRTALLRCCDDWEKGQFGCMAKEDVPAIRAYLEKQREQESAEYIKRNSKEWHSLLAEQWDRGFLEGKAEQKPEEWSKDEKIRKSLVEFFRKFTPEKVWDEIFSFGDVVSYLEKQKEQKPAEWSEEDKRKLNRIYEILGHAADDKGFLTSKRIIGDKEAIELQDFLKSLRPQHRWKPSKKQIDALNSIILIGSFTYVGQTQDLISLKDDLKNYFSL